MQIPGNPPRQTRLTTEYLHQILQNKQYREVFIPKKSGKLRRLLIPDEETKAAQRLVLKWLSYYNPHSAATGFTKHRSIYTNALHHEHSRALLHMDIRDFFPSVTPGKIHDMIEARKDIKYGLDSLSKEFEDLVTYDGHTPQGCPTSPYISNLVMNGIDAAIQSIIRRYSFRYSRYADDIIVSTYHEGSENKNNLWKISFGIERILRQHDFAIAPEKTYVIGDNKPITVTGYRVNEQVSVPREDNSRLRGLLHLALKHDKADISYIRGRIAFALSGAKTPSPSMQRMIEECEKKYDCRLLPKRFIASSR
jgi:RNA-directed DNA polymerase